MQIAPFDSIIFLANSSIWFKEIPSLRWAEINIDRLDKFIKENFKTDLHSIQLELRKMLNGE